ncbi:MAG: Mu-like prophage major head subunit gpT family protein [Roseinatronobacter sp.]
MLISTTSLNAIRVGFSAAYKRGLDQAADDWQRLATVVPSSTKQNVYGWLGKIPGMSEWVGERTIHGLAEHDYAIKNLPFELTVAVDRDDIEDDNLGVYDPMFVEMGESTAAHPGQLVYGALKDGISTACYDGQNFFDTEHPVLNKDGVPQLVSNYQTGSGPMWFLLATKRSIKPIIFQERKKPQFVALDNPNDQNVFRKKEFLYGTDARHNVGYGFWQMAFASQATLNAENYAAARAAIMSMTGDYGRPLGLMPDLLVVAPSQESAARKLLNSEYGAGGETNEWKGTADLHCSPWLAAA